MHHGPACQYDVVVASFFLNVFDEADMLRVLLHLVSLLVPGGRLLVADFAPPQGPAARRWLQRAYFGAAVRIACFIAGGAVHPI